MTVLLWLLGLLFFLLVLAVSIGLHESGHMLTAKMFKLDVPKFFVGFGKTLWSFKTKKTEYGFKIFPIGGFVQIQDHSVKEPDLSELKQELENPELTPERKKEIEKEIKKKNDSFIAQRGLLSNVAPWKRIIIYAAGPVVNLVLGVVIIYGVLMGFNSLVINNVVRDVNACSEVGSYQSCEAEKAGIQKGDRILAVDGVRFKESDSFSHALVGKESVTLIIERDGKEIEIISNVFDNYLGVNLTPEFRKLTFAESTDTIGQVFQESIISIAKLPEKMPGVVDQTFTGGERDPEAPSSIVHAGKNYGDTAADIEIPPVNKIQILLTYSGILNLSLGLINLLPLGILDGGRILFAVIDQFKIWGSKITRRKYKPLGEWEITVISTVGTVAIFMFMGMLILSDVVNIFRGQI